MKAINIWVTRACNLRCLYCYEGMTKTDRTLSSRHIELLADYIREELHKSGTLWINFHGGEPVLAFDKILELCKKLELEQNRIFYSMTTNATLLNDAVLKEIKRREIYLSVSIDGVEAAHNLNRKFPDGRGSFRLTADGVILAQKYDIPIRCRMTVTPNNYMHLFDSVKYLTALGLENIVAVPDLYDENWNEDILRGIEEIIRQIFSNGYENFTFFESEIRKKGICMGGREEINIDVNLDVYPCSYAVGNEKYLLGNIQKRGIFDNKKLNLLDAMSTEKMEDCEGCGFSGYCISKRCRILNEALTGSGNRPSPVVCGFEHLFYHVNNNLNQ